MQALFDRIAVLEFPTDAARIFHGRGGLYPGCEHLSLDSYPPVWVLTSFLPLTESELAAVQAALAARWQAIAPGQALNWVYQCRFEGRSETRLMAGVVPDTHTVSERGANYRVHVLHGQNHGLFLDMAEGRRWVGEYCRSRPKLRVLNLFAYTCAFSVVALQAGARLVVNVDMSHRAMAIGQQNHQANGVAVGARFLAHDLFSSWGKVGRPGPYDLIILDPPSYQKGSFVATKDYPRLIRRMPDLLMPGGTVLMCLNAPELDSAFLQDHVRTLAPELQFMGRIENPQAFADVSGERALKVLVFQAPLADRLPVESVQSCSHLDL